MRPAAGTPDFSAAHDVLRHAVNEQEVPGAVALVRLHGRTVYHEAFGWAAVVPERRPMAIDTIFDLASLTKPLATTPLVLQLVDQSALGLDDPLSQHVPMMTMFGGGQVTVRQLLTHTGGLPDWSPLYVWARTREDVLRAIATLEPASASGTRVIYSCPGYILLGLLVEQLTGHTLDELVAHSLVVPLSLTDSGYGPQIDAERCAWTERGNKYEEIMVAEAGLSFHRWRDDYVPGTVHDGNAWYALGGISGNAGLFGTAHDVGTVGQMWLNGGSVGSTRVLSKRLVQEATSDQTAALNEARGYGWQINRPSADSDEADGRSLSSAGSELSARAFGHTGFTGTSLWIDPDLDLVAVLLTNRVHPTVSSRTVITELRRRFHDAVSLAVRATRATPA
jgi:CubicO group peptidase (beta-lactamase class C family)